jgi:hypothetical protein
MSRRVRPRDGGIREELRLDGAVRMAWFFEGTGAQLNLRVSEEGNLSAYGTCSQSCQPTGGPTGIYRYVNGIEGSWSLHSPDAAEREYDGVGRGLKDFFAQNNGRAAGLITYYDRDEQHSALVAASILMPRSAFQDTIALLKLAMGNPKIKYVVTLDFLGLSSGAPGIPTLAEFVNPDIMRKQGYLSQEVSVTIGSC